MLKNTRLTISIIFLIMVMCLSLTNVQSAFADDNTPPPTGVPVVTEEPIATEEPAATEAPVISEETIPPAEETPVDELLSEIPDNTDLVILDENGNTVPLASQEALDIIEEADPIWCPASVVNPTAGLNGCTTNQTITGLLTLMRTNAGSAFSQDGKIFLEKPGGNGFTTSLILDNTAGSLGASFNTLKNFNLTIIGGWNGGASTTVTGESNFGSNAFVKIGTNSVGNTWVGNVTIQDINVNNNTSNTNPSVAVYTSNGSVTLTDVDVDNPDNSNAINVVVSGTGNVTMSDIDIDSGSDGSGINISATSGTVSLSNVDIQDQQDGNGITIANTSGNISLDDVDIQDQQDGYTTTITSASGNISITNGSSFDGDNNNLGFFASTTGSITITGTAGNRIEFTDAEGNGTGTNRNGATLSGSTVSLTYVNAEDNDLNGISISNATTVNLNNVNTDNNGTDPNGPNNSLGSGVLVNGTGSTIVNVTGGDFQDSERYGIEVLNGSVNIITNPTFDDNSMGNIYPDLTAPVVTANVNCSNPGNAGWCRGNVTINWTITDLESYPNGINSSGCNNVTVNSNTPAAGQTYTCTATSSGGTDTESITVYRDANAPTGVSGAPNRAPDSNGWYNHTVNIVFTGTDNNSGIASCTNTAYSGPNGTNRTVPGNCTDVAGNTSGSVNSSQFNYDGTAPTITAAILPGATLGTNGWYTSNVTVRFTCADSGGSNFNPGACPADQVLSTEGAAVSSTAQTVTDRAGNTSTPSNVITVKIDKTAPTGVTLTPTGTLGNNGWYVSDVTIITSGSELVSTPLNCTAPQSLLTDSTGTNFNGSCTNNAGFTTNAATLNVKRDTVPPTITFVSRTPANGSGWNNTNVVVTWSCTDGTSGVVSGTVTQTLTTDGANQSATGTCTDNAGHTSTDTQTGINIDKTAPSASASALPASNSNGWNNTNVTVTFSGSDGGSGLASCTSPIVLSAEGANQSASGTCTDIAGNISNTASVNGINIDKTAPTATASANPAPNGNGWNNTNVTVSFSGADALSGIDFCDANIVLSSEGAGQSASGTCTDMAGNVSNTATASGINIDKVAPVITVPANITTEATTAAGATVNYSVLVTDNLDNGITVSCTPASGSTFAITTTTVTCTSTDQAGNTSSDTFTVTVDDTTAPLLILPADIIEEAIGPSGNVVTFAVSATDAVDTNLVVSCSHTSGSTFAVGLTTVICSVTDSSNNTSTDSFDIDIQDTTAPVIAPHSDIFSTSTKLVGGNINFTSPATTDIVDGAGTATCTPASGNRFHIGETNVVCTAVDAHGNAANPVIFTVHIRYVTINWNTDGLIPVTGGSFEIECPPASFTQDFDKYSVTFTNLCGDFQGVVEPAISDGLPSNLPEGQSFMSGLSVLVLKDGSLVEPLPDNGEITVKFDLPTGTNADDVAILFWDGEKWTEMNGKSVGSNYEVTVPNGGTFVLVKK